MLAFADIVLERTRNSKLRRLPVSLVVPRNDVAEVPPRPESRRAGFPAPDNAYAAGVSPSRRPATKPRYSPRSGVMK
jgi:hypothetical protein